MMFLAVVVAGCLAGGVVQAAPITIATVTVGNAVNTADSTGYGAVDYAYNIGKYEVTNTQYTAFLNAVAATDTYGLYNTNMGSATASHRGGILRSNTSSGSYTYSVRSADWAAKPVNYVSWYDTIRFANWMTNGQGSGSTETGSYTITGGGVNSGTVSIPNHATLAAGTTTKWLLTSEDEWYKAAYHNGTTGGGAGYWDYPTASNTVPTAVTATSTGDGLAGSSGNYANFNNTADWNSQNGNVTTVGTNGGPSAYGTFDQGGNVREWNEAIIGSYRGLRGGSFGYGGGDYYLLASGRDGTLPSGGDSLLGFRVSEVPEPATMAIFALGGIGMLRRRKCVRR